MRPRHLEFPADQRELAFEISGLVAAAVLQRCLWVAFDGLGFFAVAYYWFVVIALLATYEFYRKRESRGVPIMATATGVLSLTGVATILTSTLGEQLVVLLSFSALLVFGLVSNRRLFTLWAAIGIGAAVLWFLRGYTFLLLLLLAAGLIALALWRLGKMNKAPANQQRFLPDSNPRHSIRNRKQTNRCRFPRKSRHPRIRHPAPARPMDPERRSARSPVARADDKTDDKAGEQVGAGSSFPCGICGD